MRNDYNFLLTQNLRRLHMNRKRINTLEADELNYTSAVKGALAELHFDQKILKEENRILTKPGYVAKQMQEISDEIGEL